MLKKVVDLQPPATLRWSGTPSHMTDTWPDLGVPGVGARAVAGLSLGGDCPPASPLPQVPQGRHCPPWAPALLSWQEWHVPC